MERDATDVCHVQLPARVDTLEALRLGRRLQEAASRARDLLVDASGVEEIGFAGLQLLALGKAALARDSKKLAIAKPSPAARAGIADAGLAKLLLEGADEPAPDEAGRKHSLTFTDAALDYGREPAEALRRLREAGARILPVLPDPPPALPAIEADKVLIRFDIVLPPQASPDLLADALAEYGGDALVDAPTARSERPGAPEPEPLTSADTQGAKIERVMGDVEELLTRHAALALRYASLDRDAVAELKAMGSLLRSLQDHAMAAGLMPLGALLRWGVTHATTALPTFPGSEIEIEPAVMEPLLPFLTPLLGGKHMEADGLVAREAEGLLLIEIVMPAGKAIPQGLEKAAGSVRGRAALVQDDRGALLRLTLPRSKSVLEALIVRAGDQLGALPVERTIEILRPEPADVASVGGGTQLMRFRGAYLPIVDLATALGENVPQEGTIVVVVQAAAGSYGIRVGEVSDHRQIIVKPLGDGLPAGAGVIGLTFSAGGIALVLDVDVLRLATIGGEPTG